MKRIVALLFVLAAGCSDSPTVGQQACVAAGGQCRVGPPNMCANVGPQDCSNPGVVDPGGHYCCLPSDGGNDAK
jgi:hypothetical protein